MCVTIAEEPFYKTRSTSRSIPTLLCVLILQRSSSTRSTSRGIPTLLCVAILQMSSSTRQGAPVGYIYPVVCVSTAEELFYMTRSTSGSTSTLLCVLILQDKEHQWEYTYPAVCVKTAEDLFYRTRSTSRSISTLLCVLILQRSSSTRQGAPIGVYLPCCVCKYCRGALLQDKEHQ